MDLATGASEVLGPLRDGGAGRTPAEPCAGVGRRRASGLPRGAATVADRRRPDFGSKSPTSAPARGPGPTDAVVAHGGGEGGEGGAEGRR